MPSLANPASNPSRRNRLALRFIRFALTGVPAFAAAVGLNWILVSRLHWPKSPAYAAVLAIQVLVNFAGLRYVVFDRTKARPAWQQMLGFASGVALFRILDWASYSVLVVFWPQRYVVIQLANAVVFAAPKFLFSSWVFEKQRRENKLQ
jgi:putative flippase GtrA